MQVMKKEHFCFSRSIWLGFVPTASLVVYQRSDNKGEWHGWRRDVLLNSVVKDMVVIHNVLVGCLPKSFRSTG